MAQLLEKGLTAMLRVMETGDTDVITIVYDPAHENLARALERVHGKTKPLLIKGARDKASLDRVREDYVSAGRLVLFTTESLTHHELTQEAGKNGARVVSMPNADKALFERSAGFDMKRVQEISDRLKGMMGDARVFRITSDNGTDMEVYRDGRPLKSDVKVVKRGEHANFPPGEVFFAPLETKGQGRLFFDRVSIIREGRVEFLSNAGFRVKGGKIQESLTPAGKTLYGYISAFEGFNSIAELGIGTNPWSRFKGSILEAEKVIGTCHVAFGESRVVGGVHASKVHKDGIVHKPTLTADGKELIKEGRALFYVQG